MSDGRLNGRRVVVTGGSGFLGSKLVPKLVERGASEVIVPRSAEFDLTERDAVRRLLDEARPDAIVHLAAVVGGIGANRDNPGRFFHDNMAMGLHLIEEARLHDTSQVLVVGTICAYPKFADVPFREEALWDGYPEETNAPYGIAKKALLVMGEAYQQQYGLDFTYLLPVNLYGPGDHFDLANSHVIPALIRKCVEATDRGDAEIEVWGTGQATREFLYVEDCAEAIAAAADSPSPGEPVNIGAGFEISIKDLVEMIASLTGFEGNLRFDPTKPDGQPRRCLDTTRAAKHFNWQAKTPLREGLQRTIDWYRSNRSPPTSNF